MIEIGEIIKTKIASLCYLPLSYADYKCVNKHKVANKYNRVYHIHIRKTAGSSLNTAFLRTLGNGNARFTLKGLTNSFLHRVKNENNIIVAWNKYLIEKGNYTYAFSHIPLHELNLPDNTYTITIIRDPVERIFSHYKMLVRYKKNNVDRNCMKEEAPWLGDGFIDFMKKMPKEHLMRQLYMFSPEYNVDEAFENIISCSYFFLTEDYSHELVDLSNQLDIKLDVFYIKKDKSNLTIKSDEYDFAKSILKSEIELYERLKRYKSKNVLD